MKNKEFYKDELYELYTNDEVPAFDIRTNKLTSCFNIGCNDCLFEGYGNCGKNKKEWLNSEYEEYGETIRIGDEVESNNIKGIVFRLGTSVDGVFVISKDINNECTTYLLDLDKVKKTGKHIDLINILFK